jgi:hypothetical protein
MNARKDKCSASNPRSRPAELLGRPRQRRLQRQLRLGGGRYGRRLCGLAVGGPAASGVEKSCAGRKWNGVNSLGIFTGKASCTKCHNGAEPSDATMSFAQQRGLINNDGGDQGFHNTGVRPTHEDLGRAGLGPNGAPWSQSGSPVDRGAFKTPGLRNLKLTAPYFHKGGTPTIAAVVDFYARGGDFKNPELSKDMKHISLSTNDKSDLVAFLTNALTDCRSSSTRRGSTIRRCRSPMARTCPPPACRDWGL